MSTFPGMVFVTNNDPAERNFTSKFFQATYAGIIYEFPYAKRVAIPVEAARHIFAYGQDDKRRRQVIAEHGKNFRQRWDDKTNRWMIDSTFEAGSKWLDSFHIEEAVLTPRMADDKPQVKMTKATGEMKVD